MINIDKTQVEFEYLRYKTGKCQLRNLQNRKSLAKLSGDWDKYLSLGVALLLIQAEMGQE